MDLLKAAGVIVSAIFAVYIIVGFFIDLSAVENRRREIKNGNDQ